MATVAHTHEVFLKRKIHEVFSLFQVSPDGRRVANVGKLGNKIFVVVNGKEEKQHDEIVTKGGQAIRIIFETPISRPYLAIKVHGEKE